MHLEDHFNMVQFAQNILVTGARSGFGKYLQESFNAFILTRQTNLDYVFQLAEKKPFAAIIHAAFNAKLNIDSNNLYACYQDNIELTQKLLQIPHKKFIFISSIDVYEKNNLPHTEDEVIKINSQNIYGISKLFAESMVQKHATQFLILRCSALLGKYSRPNSIIKMVQQKNVNLTLHEESEFNYILYEDVLKFISCAISHDNIGGIYNLTAAENITLQAVKNYFHMQTVFGDYRYAAGKVINNRAAALVNNFNKTSIENIKLYFLQ